MLATPVMNYMRWLPCADGVPAFAPNETLVYQQEICALLEGPVALFDCHTDVLLTQRAVYFKALGSTPSTAEIKGILTQTHFLLEDIYLQDPDSITVDRSLVRVKFPGTQKIKMHKYNYQQRDDIIGMQFNNSKHAKEFCTKLKKLLEKKEFKRFQQHSAILDPQNIKQHQKNRLGEINQEIQITDLGSLRTNAKQLIQSAQQLKVQLRNITDPDQRAKVEGILQQIFGYESDVRVEQVTTDRKKRSAFAEELNKRVVDYLNKKDVTIMSLNRLYGQFSRAMNQVISPNDLLRALELHQGDQYQVVCLQSGRYICKCSGNFYSHIEKAVLEVVTNPQDPSYGQSSIQISQQLEHLRYPYHVMSMLLEQLVERQALCFYDGFGERLYYRNMLTQ